MQEKISEDLSQILPDPAVDFTQLAESIKAWGNELGFQDISIADSDTRWRRPNPICRNGSAKVITARWIIWQSTVHGVPVRRNSFPARSVISARMSYVPPARDRRQVVHDGDSSFISRYALGRDYHKVLRGPLQKLADKITAETGYFNGQLLR
jgi:epoxyqueuosine reductase